MIGLSEINDPQNCLLLARPAEKAFDEGRIIFLFNPSTGKFELKVLDPNIWSKSFTDLSGDGGYSLSNKM